MQPPLNGLRPGSASTLLLDRVLHPLDHIGRETSLGSISTARFKLRGFGGPTPNAPRSGECLGAHCCWIKPPMQPLNHLGDGWPAMPHRVSNQPWRCVKCRPFDSRNPVYKRISARCRRRPASDHSAGENQGADHRRPAPTRGKSQKQEVIITPWLNHDQRTNPPRVQPMECYLDGPQDLPQ